MLQRLAVILLGLVLVVTPSLAQDTTPMIIRTECSSIDELRSYLAEEHNELAFTSAPGLFRRADGKFAAGLFRTYLNPETFSYTLTVEFTDIDFACIIAMGEQFAPVIHDGIPL